VHINAAAAGFQDEFIRSHPDTPSLVQEAIHWNRSV
jgi:hypothetical protein